MVLAHLAQLSALSNLRLTPQPRRPNAATVSEDDVGASICMAFKLTYSDGQESDYDDDTVWEVDDGVLKLGRNKGQWSVLLSPSHWAVIELGGAKPGDDDDAATDDDENEDEAKSDNEDE